MHRLDWRDYISRPADLYEKPGFALQLLLLGLRVYLAAGVRFSQVRALGIESFVQLVTRDPRFDAYLKRAWRLNIRDTTCHVTQQSQVPPSDEDVWCVVLAGKLKLRPHRFVKFLRLPIDDLCYL